MAALSALLFICVPWGSRSSSGPSAYQRPTALPVIRAAGVTANARIPRLAAHGNALIVPIAVEPLSQFGERLPEAAFYFADEVIQTFVELIDGGNALFGKYLIVFVRRLFHVVESFRAVVDDRIEFQCALAHEGHCKWLIGE